MLTILIAVIYAVLVRPSTVSAGLYDNWAPHRYCNAIDDIEDTRIPPLSPGQAERVQSLEQVQVIARHGARAPYARLFCWESNVHNPMGAEWNCTTASVSSQDINPNEHTKGFGRLYRKSYMNGHNILRGDCIVGGLLPLGRQQQKTNGRFLRDSYVGESQLKLFPTANLSHLELSKIYLRSDDQERTLGSGQALVDGLFPVDGTQSLELHHMLSWDVADISVDYINPNENICPLMGHIGQLANESPEFWNHLRDPSTVEIEHHFRDVVGNFSWNSVLECLSTARCNNLELPQGVDEDTFTKTFHEVEVRQSIFLSYNNSEYAKLAMQPLAHDMLRRLDSVLDEDPHAYKLSVTMAHDSTIMPFLAATVKENWDRLWTPYAGMLVIEVYKTKNNSHAIRVIFHGEPQHIPECHDTLCNIDDFLSAFSFARKPRTNHDCVLPKDKKEKSKDQSNLATTLAGGNAGAKPFEYHGSYLLLGVVGVAGLLAVRAKVRRTRQHDVLGDDEAVSLLPTYSAYVRNKPEYFSLTVFARDIIFCIASQNRLYLEAHHNEFGSLTEC
ncbi:component of the counting factor complex [Plasmopara halstedii]|uniref:Component of the counting factor complex n=1 Tax=Plasmopara halstedii TaxID=4781 RepID=A0A0P1A9E0_PLAHL|nr:component of the counting factor complex [Plasmopara halstedii]CEG37143.1 component of the counting factor complex [Plasmopara halstedii]|eukprot:XP_024573512.1 component of the counting factor complex [Plasmopara halstedii]